MKIIKLILGILCILLAGFVAFQSFFLGSGNALFKPLEVSGTIAIIIIALMSICGLTMTFTFRSSGVGGEMFCILLLSLATVAGVLFRGNIPELRPWTWICLALDVINLLFPDGAFYESYVMVQPWGSDGIYVPVITGGYDLGEEDELENHL